MTRGTWKRILGFAVLVPLGACQIGVDPNSSLLNGGGGGGGGAGGSQGSALDSATAIQQAEAIAGDVQLFVDAQKEATLLGGSSPCTYDAGTTIFTCPTKQFETLTLDRQFQLLDGSASVQASYDPSTTTTALFIATEVGNVSIVGMSEIAGRAWSAVVTGMNGASTQHTINAVGIDTATSQVTIGGVTRSIQFSSQDTVTNMVMATPIDSATFPVSGTMTRNVTLHETAVGSQVVDILETKRILVTFDGTATPTATIGVLTCTVHLDTRAVTCGL